VRNVDDGVVGTEVGQGRGHEHASRSLGLLTLHRIQKRGETCLFGTGTGITTEMEESLFPMGSGVLFRQRGRGGEGSDGDLSANETLVWVHGPPGQTLWDGSPVYTVRTVMGRLRSTILQGCG
jgi:hypothetical protein